MIKFFDLVAVNQINTSNRERKNGNTYLPSWL